MKEIDETAALNLYGSINAGRMQEAEQALKDSPDLLHGFYGHQKQPMMVDAAESGHPNVMAWLHAHGASFEQVDAVGFTALHAAAYGGQPRVVEYLLDKNVCLEPVCEGGETPLLTAGRMGHLEVFDLLCAAGANPHATTGTDNGDKDALTLFLGQLSEMPSVDPDYELPDRYKSILWGLCERLGVAKPMLAARVVGNDEFIKQINKAGWEDVLADLKSIHLDQQWQQAQAQAPRLRM